MGRHADAGRSRGLAKWVIIAVVAVLVVGVAVAGYIVVVVRSDATKTGVCTSTVSLSVVAGPGSAPAVTAAADAYNKTRPVARSACVTASVSAVPDRVALSGLEGRWSTKSGPPPGLWIPDSAASLAALDAVRPDLAAGHPTDPFAWSPVVLAMLPGDVSAVGSTAWADLPQAVGSQGTVSLPGGRSLIVAFPPVADNRASGYALQSVAAGNDPSVAVTTEAIRTHATLLDQLAADTPDAPPTTFDALATLAASTTGKAGTGAVTAVPVVEADLVRFDARRPATVLAAVHPHGAAVGDALIAAPISAPWTNRGIIAAASDFQAYLGSVAGQQILADHGWRTVSAHPSTPLPEVNTQADVTMIPAGGPDVDHALAVALGQAQPTHTSAPPRTTPPSTPPSTPSTAPTTAPSTPSTAPTTPPPTTSTTPPAVDLADHGPVLTLIVDTSSGMATKDDGQSLLYWVQKALRRLIDGSVTDRVGLWAYSDAVAYPPSGFPQLVPTGPITQKITVHSGGGTVTELRSKALAAAVAGLEPDGDRWAYGALMEALTKIPAPVQGRESRVVLITSGVDQTPGTPRRMVLDAVKQAHTKTRVDVIGLGDAVPVDAYTDIAAAGGGKYFPAVDVKHLGQQLVDLLTLGE